MLGVGMSFTSNMKWKKSLRKVRRNDFVYFGLPQGEQRGNAKRRRGFHADDRLTPHEFSQAETLEDAGPALRLPHSDIRTWCGNRVGLKRWVPLQQVHGGT